MYGIVMMMALSGSADVASFGRHGGGGYAGYPSVGCFGCAGGMNLAYYRHVGGYGYGSYGAYGGYSGYGYGSGYSGCYGCAGYGSYGGGYGCYGGWGCAGGTVYGSFGGTTGYGSYGGLYNSGPNSGNAIYSGPSYGGAIYGGSSYGGPMNMNPVPPTGVPTLPSPAGGTKTPLPPPPSIPGKTSANNRATIVVTLPADATLTFDGHQTSATSSPRRFVTPALQSGVKYRYELRAEVVRNGTTSVVTRTVDVRANQQLEISLDFANTDLATRR